MMRRLVGSKWTGVLTGKCERKKKILSLLAAATLCMGLMAVPFNVSAVTVATGEINGVSCTGNLYFYGDSGQSTASFGGTASYIYTDVVYTYGYGSSRYTRSASNEAQNVSSCGAVAYKNQNHTYIQPISTQGTFRISTGSNSWHPNQGPYIIYW